MRRPTTYAARLAATVLILGATAAVPARADAVRYRDKIFTTVQTQKDVKYGQNVNNYGVMQDLLLDVYTPAGDAETGRPVFLWVHGGGFKTGNKSSGKNNATEFAQRGYVAASIGYRLRPPGSPGSASNQELIAAFATGGEPTQISDARHDVQAAVRWIRANAAALGADPTRISIGGGSAGAVTALGVNFRSDDPGDSGNPGHDSSISAALSIAGAWMAADIDPGEKPIYMFHGTNDTTVPFVLGAQTCAAQTGLLNTCEMTVNPGGGHGAGEEGGNIVLEMVDFLCRHVVGC